MGKIEDSPEIKKIADDILREMEKSSRKRLRSISIKYGIFLVITYLLLTFLFKKQVNLILFAVLGLVGFVFVYIFPIIKDTIKQFVNSLK